MELVRYWRIVRRRLWIVIVLVLALTISYVAGAPRP